MYSTAWVNLKFEIKDTCIEFLINNDSPQGNNVKIKLNLIVDRAYSRNPGHACGVTTKGQES